MLANKLGMANIFDPLSLTDDTSVFERAVAIASSLGDIGATASAHEWLGYMCYGFGRFREGVTHIRTALEWARKLGEPRLIARIKAVLGQILAASCQYDEATALIDAAISTTAAAAMARSPSARPIRCRARAACWPIGAISLVPRSASTKR